MASLMDVTCAGDDREMMRVPDFHRALIFWPLLPQSILLSYGMCPVCMVTVVLVGCRPCKYSGLCKHG